MLYALERVSFSWKSNDNIIILIIQSLQKVRATFKVFTTTHECTYYFARAPTMYSMYTEFPNRGQNHTNCGRNLKSSHTNCGHGSGYRLSKRLKSIRNLKQSKKLSTRRHSCSRKINKLTYYNIQTGSKKCLLQIS